MTNILLLLSILLNIVALLCIVILYLRQNRFLQVEKKQEKLLGEMEEVISTYLIEMTEENEKFINKVKELVKSQKSFTSPPSEIPMSSKREAVDTESNRESTADIQQEPEKESEGKEFPSFRKGTVFQAVQAYKSTNSIEKLSNNTEPELPLIDPKKNVKEETAPQKENQSSDLYTQSFFYQALLLQKQGLSTEDIARRLNKGKTEIELLLKLRQNEKE